ncbi:MAG: helix-turn-helix domain-containing protein [Draconibacterium sp.]
MKDRIKDYMEHNDINAGELASMLDVQRSNISHILNGRNKPGAAFIEKMLTVFPDLNARWLLTGEGTMVDDNNATSEPLKMVESDDALDNNKLNGIQIPNTEAKQKSLTESILLSEAVEKIILLYKDGTFTTFRNRE